MAQDSVEIYVEGPAGERFSAEVPRDMRLAHLAADFFTDRNWPQSDASGRGQRAVVELVNPHSPDQTKRLNSQSTVADAGVAAGSILRIFPEAVAGSVDPRIRLNALTLDHKDMQRLVGSNSRISFAANKDYAPDLYDVEFRYESFVELVSGTSLPRTERSHRVKITLDAEYPQVAPSVRWLTPIFHPNIRQPEGVVCLGVLNDRYLPSLGLGRLVHMLAEMVQWRNFDATNAFNPEAADWALEPENWATIAGIGGHPFEGSIEQFLRRWGDFQNRPRSDVRFRPVVSAGGRSAQSGDF